MSKHRIQDQRSAGIRDSAQQPQQSRGQETSSQQSFSSGGGLPILSAPQLSLPKGGGAIQSMDEKLSVHSNTGAASLSIPLYISPGRQEFQPALSLSYDSGAGNSPFGLGCSVSIPSITRKTAKGIPTYRDSEDADTFIFGGAEDLVPFNANASETGEATSDVFHRVEEGVEYRVRRYRPRIEGLFIRIERWTEVHSGIIHWRSVSKDQVTSIYGKKEEARIADPQHPNKIFQWNLEQSYDTKGNIIVYEYKREDGLNVKSHALNEQHRFKLSKFSNLYLKRIRYGNQRPFEASEWLFEVVFDYGEHGDLAEIPQYELTREWSVRKDPFSSYRSGFEIRTYRLCQRVLMYHHFVELGEGPTLTRSTNFTYEHGAALTTLIKVEQIGFRKGANGHIEQQTFPPLELNYSKSVLQGQLKELDPTSLENAPAGIDGDAYRLIDLDGEGLPGILAQGPNAWYYKRNLGNGKFGTQKLVDPLPALARSPRRKHQLTDVTGSGQLDLVEYDGTRAGFYERNEEGSWQPFTPLHSIPNVNWNDPNLRFIDLTGDGRLDLLLTEDTVFTYYPTKGSEGFGLPQRVQKEIDEEKGPNLVFADAIESIYLADMSGDGLTDLVRIRNGEICYWPNLGYGRFGAKVTMDRSPRFASMDRLDPQRLRLADIDGSGTTDLIYLGETTIEVWFNQAGNAWGEKQKISSFPPIDNLAYVQVADLLGIGVTCLVWSSPLPTHGARRVLYMDLMGGVKPHLLTSIQNNLGKEEKLHYTSSTQFYLEDKKRGQPWLTPLPFPVQVVERTELIEHVTGATYSSRYSYHHGYYDGIEREFRGFGLVKQWDTDQFSVSNELDQPPVLTKTWFHTGAWLGRQRMTDHFRNEYYAGDSKAFNVAPTLFPPNLTNEEKRQACQALKGQPLRTEIYRIDGTPQSEHPFQVMEYAYQIQRLQAAFDDHDAVFYVYQSEAVTYHYERNPEDPRVARELTLEVDEFGNTRKAAAIAYPRRNAQINDQAKLAPQMETVVIYTESDYVNRAEADVYRIGTLLEQRAYELTGLPPTIANGLFSMDELVSLVETSELIPFEVASNKQTPQKKLVQSARIRYWKDDLSGPLPMGEVDVFAFPYETYELALTPGLIAEVYGDRVDRMLLAEAGYVEMDGNWWLASGYPTFDATRFYHPIAYTDPFGAMTTTKYDKYALFPIETVAPDPLPGVAGDVTRISYDYRTLQAEQLIDPNGNRSVARFDALGMVAATALMAKPSEQTGDSLAEFVERKPNTLAESVADPHHFLQQATTRFMIDLDAFQRERQPVGIHTIARETHHFELGPNEVSRVQHLLSYQDGLGRELMTKARAEAGKAPDRDPQTGALIIIDNQVQMVDTPMRWIGSGRTIYDNKGNPVKQYEPFFTDGHDYEEEAQLVMWGVSSILRYDPLGRLIRTDFPDGSFEKVAFDPWSQTQWDGNDTVLESEWYRERNNPDPTGAEPSDPDRRAAWLAAQHANTPAMSYLDTLGQAFLQIEDNGEAGQYEQRITFDLSGNPLEVTDAKQRVVMRTRYDLLGRPLETNSVDQGMRWMFVGADEQPVRLWDERGHQFEMRYDALRRPTETWIHSVDSGDPYLSAKVEYGEAQPQAEKYNLRGQVYRQFDQAGIVVIDAYDFKGNPLSQRRTLTESFDSVIDWSANPSMESDSYEQTARFDALNRPIAQQQPDQSVLYYSYQSSGLLTKIAGVLPNGQQQSQAAFVEQIDYNARGQRERIVYGNGVETSYVYDEQTFRLTRLETIRLSDSARLQALAYTYDPVGNVTEIHDEAQQTTFFKNSVVEPNSRFSYDPLYRLKKAEGREASGQGLPMSAAPKELPIAELPHAHDNEAMRRYVEEYEYDEVGNLIRLAHRLSNPAFQDQQWTRHYQYEAENHRLLSTSLPGDDTDVVRNAGEMYSARYAYDAHGNMTQMPHLAKLDWDPHDQLRRVDLGGGGEEFYTYDAAGERVRKTHRHRGGSTIEQRIYFGGFEIYRKSRKGQLELERTSLHVLDGNARIALIETKKIDTSEAILDSKPVIRYQLHNHLQSASIELDEVGRLISYEEYLPFGERAYQSGRNAAETSLKRYRYTGKERDETTGLYYYGARYYLAWLGRWASADPAGFVDGLNLYAYVSNNPLKYVDPEGLQSQEIDGYLSIGENCYPNPESSGDQPELNQTEESNEKKEFTREQIIDLLQQALLIEDFVERLDFLLDKGIEEEYRSALFTLWYDGVPVGANLKLLRAARDQANQMFNNMEFLIEDADRGAMVVRGHSLKREIHNRNVQRIINRMKKLESKINTLGGALGVGVGLAIGMEGDDLDNLIIFGGTVGGLGRRQKVSLATPRRASQNHVGRTIGNGDSTRDTTLSNKVNGDRIMRRHLEPRRPTPTHEQIRNQQQLRMMELRTLYWLDKVHGPAR
ncbi:hypothetical protein BEP19_02225 [Ammoniphilus oxalaticus]|uniref:Toxin n=1 Tax=Ammoniphilus oxalaticus TaxID=66863 RepID=A0A419SNB1_9BACL|nr:SpvB/TcaC N-terminal domain-containing protein [Ammoniphilus oxalaticus]RKD25778.1 hypothetical protein BEP19_02225 [Ammoniphilus oxalaticus]